MNSLVEYRYKPHVSQMLVAPPVIQRKYQVHFVFSVRFMFFFLQEPVTYISASLSHVRLKRWIILRCSSQICKKHFLKENIYSMQWLPSNTFESVIMNIFSYICNHGMSKTAFKFRTIHQSWGNPTCWSPSIWFKTLWFEKQNVHFAFMTSSVLDLWHSEWFY